MCHALGLHGIDGVFEGGIFARNEFFVLHRASCQGGDFRLQELLRCTVYAKRRDRVGMAYCTVGNVVHCYQTDIGMSAALR